MAAEIRDITGCQVVGVLLLEREGCTLCSPQLAVSGEQTQRPPWLNCDPSQCRWCRAVISGHTDASLRNFTEYGSFFSNSLDELHTLLVDQDAAEPSCVSQGYRSIAVTPILQGQHTVGLILAAETEGNRITTELLQLLEELSAPLGSILARLRTEQELRRSEARYRSLFETAGVAIFVGELQGERLELTDCNQQALQLFAGTREELLGHTPFDLAPATQPDGRPSREVALDMIAQTLISGPQTFEFRHLRTDGTWFDAEITLSATSQEEICQLQAIVRDLSEQKRLQAEMLQRKRHESIGRLAGGIAHNLNTALSPIMLAVERIRLLRDDEWLHQRLDTIDDCADRAASLVRHIVAFARGAQGKSTTVSVILLLEHVIAFLELTFPRGIKTSSSIADDLWPVLGVSGQLEQALLHLCINAREAIAEASQETPEGEIDLAADNIEIAETEAVNWPRVSAGRWVVITVSDSGAGMTPQELERIFDPFSSTMTDSTRLGLGLSTVFGIVSSHGGFVNACSQPDSGTEVSIYLPALQ